MGLNPDDPRLIGQRTVAPEDAAISLCYHEGSYMVDGLGDQRIIAVGALMIVATPTDRKPGELMTLSGIRGDGFEAAKALAHFLHGNRAFADIVLATLEVLRTGLWSGGPDREGG